MFASNVGGSGVNLLTGPDGNLYYLSRGSSALYKITSNNVSAPVIVTHPASASKAEGSAITFSVTANGTSPQYQWQKNEVPILNANQNTFIISDIKLSDAGNYRVVVSNTAGQAISNNATLTLIANTKPVVQIISPVVNTTYVAGTSISFSGSATDAEDGTLTAAAMSWQINFHHDMHKHDEPVREGISSGTFEIPDQGETSSNVWYRFILSVTDSKGSVGKDSVDVLPRKSILTFSTLPIDLQITLDGQPVTTPASITSVEGLKRELGVIDNQEVNGTGYQFMNWQHGGAATQTIVTPTEDIAFTAVFSPVLGVENTETLVFPNPTKDWFFIRDQNASSITLTNLVGQSWNLASERTNKLTSVNVTTLPVGIYILSFSSNQILFRHKLLIQR